MVKGKYEQTAAADIKTVNGLKNKLCSRGYSKNQFFPESCAACRACCFGVRLVQLMEQNGAVYESHAQERSFTSELLKSNSSPARCVCLVLPDADAENVFDQMEMG